MLQAGDAAYTERPQISIDGTQTLPLKGMLASFLQLCRGKTEIWYMHKIASRTNELDFRPLWWQTQQTKPAFTTQTLSSNTQHLGQGPFMDIS